MGAFLPMDLKFGILITTGTQFLSMTESILLNQWQVAMLVLSQCSKVKIKMLRILVLTAYSLVAVAEQLMSFKTITGMKDLSHIQPA